MRSIYLTVFCLLFISVLTTTASAAENREWSFRVLLDGREVGSQKFVLSDESGKTRLKTEADFKVKFMFATLYRYLHTSEETWEGNCLAEIQSTTDANGKSYSVSGEQRGDFFEVTVDGQAEKLPGCVMSFAYWNPSFLEHERLLNAQNGEYLDVKISTPEPVFRTIRGEEVAALRYHLAAGELDVHLWYSAENEWLALESKTKGKRTLSYELL